MEDIQLTGNDGDYLVLETTAGEKFRLINDESLQAATKKLRSSSTASTMSPREMQDAVRDGMSIDEIVATSGATFEFVEKFAAPVISELAHIIETAKTLRLPNLSEGLSIEFGEFVASRLAGLAATNVIWSTKRTDFNVWHISVAYNIKESKQVAVWSFDPKRLLLSPENEKAVNLGKRENASAAFLGGLLAEASAAPATNETVKLSLVESAPEAKILPPASVEIDDEAHITSDPQIVEEAPNAPLSATADLLQALRRKRADNATIEQSETAPIEIVQLPLHATAQIEKHDESEPAPKKGRTSMPSWDQIVFGTKTEE